MVLAPDWNLAINYIQIKSLTLDNYLKQKVGTPGNETDLRLLLTKQWAVQLLPLGHEAFYRRVVTCLPQGIILVLQAAVD